MPQLSLNDAPRHKVADATASRFTRSAVHRDGVVTPTATARRWLAERRAANRFAVRRIALDDLEKWHFDAGTGNIVHDSDRFFTIEGLDVRTDYGPVHAWQQPVINQPEIGILGILVKEFDGVLHCLMQAKMEPGNSNVIQLSPTVQATRSNYTQVHRGSVTRYLEYFAQPRRGRVLVDVLQSEQGSWFYRKRNRNMVVEVDEDVPAHEDFCWLTIGQLRELLAEDDVLNMDTRAVISCIRFAEPGPEPEPDADLGNGEFTGALRRSVGAGAASALDMGSVLSWFTENKTRHQLKTRLTPLAGVEHWHRSDDAIARDDGRFFRVVAVAVEASNREVTRWTQPLVAPNSEGIVAFLVRPIKGVLHVLAHARVEPGYLDTVELAPTVQSAAENYRHAPASARPPFLDYVLRADRAAIRYDAYQSEEGGRFYHARNRYMIIEADDDIAAEVPPDYLWLTLRQLGSLLAHPHYLNIEARSLVACLHSLW
jgi:oxidase EvaA